MTKKRRGFDHWLGNQGLPQANTPEETQALYPLVRAGDEAAKGKMILGHMKFAFALVGNLSGLSPHTTDDMVGVAMTSLVDGVGRISQGAIDHHEIPNVTGYLSLVIVGDIKKSLSQDQTIKMSRLASARAEYKPPKFQRNLEHLVSPETLSALEIQDVLNAIAENDRERSVILSRLEQKTDGEIGFDLAITGERVRQIRKVLGRRFSEKFLCL